MTETPDPTGVAPADENWLAVLEALAGEDSSLWMPPGPRRLDWHHLDTGAAAGGESLLAGLWEGRHTCEFPIPSTEPGADSAWLRPQLHDLATGAEPAGGDGSAPLFLGFPYLWVPPGLLGDEASSPILMPLALLAIELDSASTPGMLAIRIRSGAPPSAARLQPNPTFLRWLEGITGESQPAWVREAPAEPWELVSWLVERAAAAGLPTMDVPDVPPFGPFPALNALPFFPAVIPAAVLGQFPDAPTRWQSELRALLDREDWQELKGPVAGFFDPARPSVTPTSRAPMDEPPPWWPGKAEFLPALPLAQAQELSIIRVPDEYQKTETATLITGDALSRGEWVRVISDSEGEAGEFDQAMDGLGIGRLCSRASDGEGASTLPLPQLIKKFTPTPSFPAPESPATLERQWEELMEQSLATSRLLHEPVAGGPSFHELAGEWLELLAVVPPEAGEPVEPPDISEVETHRDAIEAALNAALAIEWADSPWRDSLIARPEVVRATSLTEWERVFSGLIRQAEAADRAMDGNEFQFSPDQPITEQVAARHALEEILTPLTGWDRTQFCTRVTRASPTEVEALTRQRETLAQSAAEMMAQPLDADMWVALRDRVPSVAAVSNHLRVLESRLPNPPSNQPPGSRAMLLEALSPLRLKNTPEHILRAWTFYRGLWHRLQLVQMVTAWLQASGGRLLDDTQLQRDWEGTGAVLAAMEALRRPALDSVRDQALEAIQSPDRIAAFIDALRRSTRSAQTLADFEQAVAATRLFSPDTLKAWRVVWNRGHCRSEMATAWHLHVRHLPEAVAVHASLKALPSTVAAHATWHATRGAAPDTALLSMRRAACAGELQSRCHRSASLREVTGTRLEASFLELAQIAHRRYQQAQWTLLRNWSFRRLQKGPGASDRALATGQTLTELRPIWIASPAQAIEIFPPGEVFDLVIFLNGERCALGEAVPVLLRAKRALVLESSTHPSAADPASPEEFPSSGPRLVKAVAGLGCPRLSLDSSGAGRGRESEFTVPVELPYSRVHSHGTPSRTLAAIGALLRNQCHVSNEVHWLTRSGEIDIALVDSLNPATPLIGILVDLPPGITNTPVAAHASRWEALTASGYSLRRLTTPELVQHGAKLLSALAANAGISPAPAHPSATAADVWPNFNPRPIQPEVLPT